jgi:actin-like ATPase involved in cell morphogenesis
VGKRAKEELGINPKLVIWGAKRLVGLTYREACRRNELARFQFDISEAPDGSILIRTGNKEISPAAVLEIVLREIRENAQNPVVNETLAAHFSRAVIGVPAYFTAVRVGHIIEAAHRAGFTEVDTIAEPTAAAIRYSLTLPRRDTRVLVFDMGAGTLDTTLVRIIYERDRMLVGEFGISGNEWLGGMDMDDMLTEHLAHRHSLGDLGQDPKWRSMLKEEIEQAKIGLGRKVSVDLDLPNHKTVELTRTEMEAVLAPLLDRCRQPIHAVLSQAGCEAADIGNVLFVGGPARMQCVRSMVRDELAKLGATAEVLGQIEAIQREEDFPVDPMECVAQGSALCAAGVLEPIMRIAPEGYGTTYPVPGNAPYYDTIIKHGSFYPSEGRSMVTYGNARAKVIYFDLAVKRADPERPGKFRYEMLGWQPFFIQPTGKLPWVEVRLKISEQKELVTELIHFQTGQSVKYRRLNLLQGEEVDLQEEEKPSTRMPVTGESDVSGWTPSQLERLIRVANVVLELIPAGPNADSKMDPEAASGLTDAAATLQFAVDAAVMKNQKEPNNHAPPIANRIAEVVHALYLAKLVTQEERENYLRDLAKIIEEPESA